MDDYNAVLENVKDTYDKPIMSFLNRCVKVIREAGMYADDPFEMHDDTCRWVFRAWANEEAHQKGDNLCADITVEIAEEREYEGGEGFGMSFGMNIVEYGGLILGQFQPFNYTPEVWVDARDPEAVAARWQFFEDVDVKGILPLLDDLPQAVA